MTDYAGIAQLIVSIATLISSIVGSIILLRKVEVTHELVNGLSKQKDRLIEKEARREGGDAERENPTPKR